MNRPDVYKVPPDTRRFIVLNPRPPFLDILLKLVDIDAREFAQLNTLALSWENDPRLIEMIRLGGDGSGKVPYLMDEGETPDSILTTLREMAAPHLEHLRGLPERVQATIHLLLSINALPHGCEDLAIPALLEIDHIHADLLAGLHRMMSGRAPARRFCEENLLALQQLDRQWPTLQKQVAYPLPATVVPRSPRMEFEPGYDRRGRLVHVYETCVIIPTRQRDQLLRLTPSILRRPLPAGVPVPPIGSTDWLLREVGKVGRHFTRSMLHMVKARLAAEEVPLEARNYRLINEQALQVWQDFVQKLP